MNLLSIIGERDFYKDKADEIWNILVMLKREFDKHETKEGFLQIEKSTWDEAVKRANKFAPH